MKILKCILSMTLCLFMVMTLFPANTFAFDGTNWEGSESIGIYMEKEARADVSNRRYSNTGDGTFSATEDEIELPVDGSKRDFVAYYPYSVSIITGDHYAIDVSDQTSLSAIDFMRSNKVNGIGKENRDISFEFTPRLAKIQVNLTVGDGVTVSDLVGASVTIDKQYTRGTFSLLTEDAQPIVDLSQPATVVTLYTNDDGSRAEGILFPREDSNDPAIAGRKITVTLLDGREFVYDVLNTQNFVAGCLTIIGLQLRSTEDDNIAELSNSTSISRGYFTAEIYNKRDLTVSEITRTSDTKATIKFSSQSDKYGYTVVESGSAEPINVMSTLFDIQSGENKIELTNLTAGEKDIYISVTANSAGSDRIFKYTIPVYVPDIYTASVTPDGKTFDSKTIGYSAITPETFTIENTGNQTLLNLAVTLNGTNVADFILDTNNIAVQLDSLGGTTTSTTFRVKPRDGLEVGTYTANIKVNADNMTEINKVVNFTVNPRADASITPTSASYDRYNPTDVTITKTDRYYAFSSISNGTVTLVNGTDYFVNGNIITISKDYLKNLQTGTSTFTIHYGMNTNPTLNINISDTTPTRSITVIQAVGGTISVDPTTGKAGDIITIKAKRNNGYQLKNILVDGTEITGNTFVMKDADAEVTAVFEKVKAPEYRITIDDISSWTRGSDKSLIFKGDGELDKLVSVKTDNNNVDSKNYDKESGSTIIKLKSSYLETLSTGEHTLEMVWTDGSATTTFTIEEEIVENEETDNENTDAEKVAATTSTTTPTASTTAPTPSPEKKNKSNVLVYLVCILIALGIIASVLIIKKRRTK